MISLKTEAELTSMRQACHVASKMAAQLFKAIKPGVTGITLNQIAEQVLAQEHAQSAFKGYYGYPAHICVAVNEVLIHGIPNGKPFQAGDLVSVDLGAKVNGYYADMAFTKIVGQARSKQAQALVDTTRECLEAAIKLVKPGVQLGTIGHAIETIATKAGFKVPREYSGHGIGQALHEDPYILNYGTPGQGFTLKAGMTICIEPMLQVKTAATKTLADGWTVVNAAHELAAHFEHTMLVTATGCEVLTVQPEPFIAEGEN